MLEGSGEVDAVGVAESVAVDHVTDLGWKIHKGEDFVLGKWFGDLRCFGLLITRR